MQRLDITWRRTDHREEFGSTKGTQLCEYRPFIDCTNALEHCDCFWSVFYCRGLEAKELQPLSQHKPLSTDITAQDYPAPLFLEHVFLCSKNNM
ncbi:UNVERIFIED_CONTAM: hypothetical protein FKN15_025503 [Acipenser sinensis]